MITRMVLHGLTTAASALIAIRLTPDAPMWVRMSLYAAAWIACALAYVPLLYCWEHLVDAFDARMRRLIRDEFERHELASYQRRLEREERKRRRPPDRD